MFSTLREILRYNYGKCINIKKAILFNSHYFYFNREKNIISFKDAILFNYAPNKFLNFSYYIKAQEKS